ncbi:MAG: two-component regulator propeller domain-containing protein, partial [Terracidiphilus sp.]
MGEATHASVDEIHTNSKKAGITVARLGALRPESTIGCNGLRRLTVLLLFSCAMTALALEPSTPLANYGRQTWVMENGLPQNTVQALVQTQDGFVWLGTEVGLVRFDGNGFLTFDQNTSPALPGNDVRCLLAAKDGALWIGTGEGLARWKDGAVTTFTTKDGLPGNSIESLSLNPDDSIWIETDKGGA